MASTPEPGASRPDGGFATRAIHAAHALNETSALTPPIFQSSTFRLPSTSAGAEFTSATAPTEFYTRWGNPTTRAAEVTLATLEGSEAAIAFSSGMGAISSVLLSLLRSGDRLLVGRSIYSGTLEIAQRILPRFGVEASLVDTSSLDAVERAFADGPARALIFESPTNPTLEIADLAGIASRARKHGVLTIVDNTFATPYNQRPLSRGIDIVVHAATKALGGHSDLTAGVICSSKEIVEGAWPMLKIFGACLSPFESWLLLRGLKTLALRVERQNETALALAQFLESHDRVERVHYPGLPAHPGHSLAREQMSGFGSMLSFEVAGGYEAGVRLVESLELVALAVSLGGVESTISHPASMSHGSLTEEERRSSGIRSGLLRLSVGLEDSADLKRDLARALESV